MITRNYEMVTSVREQMRGGPGEVLLTALTPELPANMRLFSKITLKPGCGIGFHVHEKETELFYFVSGKGVAQDDDQTVEVAAGDSMTTPNGHGHSVTNTGDEDLVFVAAIVLD